MTINELRQIKSFIPGTNKPATNYIIKVVYDNEMVETFYPGGEYPWSMNTIRSIIEDKQNTRVTAVSLFSNNSHYVTLTK